MAIQMNWPHSYAVIFENKLDIQLNLPWLGRHGLILRPKEKIAIVGDPLTVPNDPRRYNGKKSIADLAKLIAAGQLEVLSRPGGDKEEDNTTVPMLDANGNTLPNCRIEF